MTTLVDIVNPKNKYRNSVVAKKTIEERISKYATTSLVLMKYMECISKSHPELLQTAVEEITEDTSGWISKYKNKPVKPKVSNKNETLMDMFCKRSPQLVEIVYHKIGKYGKKDLGGLWQLMTTEVYLFLPNCITRVVECACTPIEKDSKSENYGENQRFTSNSKNYDPDTIVGFLFLILLTTQPSIKNLVENDLKDDQEKHFFTTYYYPYIRKMLDDVLSSDFHELNCENLLITTMSIFRRVWFSRSIGEIMNSNSFWKKLDDKTDLLTQRSRTEKVAKKRYRQDKAQKRRKFINHRRNQGIAEYWIISKAELKRNLELERKEKLLRLENKKEKK